jgi:hypothetical protein
LKVSQTPWGKSAAPTSISVPTAGKGSRREGGDDAQWPKQLPWQDQTWQSPCCGPGTREGKLAGGRRPSWRGLGRTAEATTLRLQQPSAWVRSDEGGVGAAGPRRQPVEGGSEVAPGAQESAARPPRALWTEAWGFPGPGSRPLGKIPAPFPAPRLCRAERGRGFPESAQRPAWRH